jgi:predicted enzyme related to lactoylglutathione lyase
MSNAAGAPVWYELITPDPDGAKNFYDAVMGWDIQPPPSDALDYRMIGAGGGYAGGVLKLDAEMKSGGMRPAWMVYFGVQDVDKTAEHAVSLGGKIFVPPTDIANVGRFSFLSDPQGAMFYVMRPATDQTSTVFSPGQPGLCGWNELWTDDIEGALSFYGRLLGFENSETMKMGPRGGYHFLDIGDMRLGAAAEMKPQPPQWNIYFTVPDIDSAVRRVNLEGGSITMGPLEVPTGDRILLGVDAQGANFALVASTKT